MKTDYVLITPVHNEKDILEAVIESVISQTIRPIKWIIVDDVSTDGTGDIIKKYCTKYEFIEGLHLQSSKIEGYYAHKTEVILAGYERIKDLQYSFMGNLDADIVLPQDYYEKVLEEFDKDSKLGIASGVYFDKIGDKLQQALIDKNCCPGAIQMFRRECYEAIGGFIPLKYGGEDTCAEIMARMNGWHTRSFSEIHTIHLRPMGIRNRGSILRARFYQGLTEYGIGSHPLFVMFKCLRRALLEKPFITGGILRMAGFIYGYLIREKRGVSVEVTKYVRKEQIKRLLSLANR